MEFFYGFHLKSKPYFNSSRNILAKPHLFCFFLGGQKFLCVTLTGK